MQKCTFCEWKYATHARILCERSCQRRMNAASAVKLANIMRIKYAWQNITWLSFESLLKWNCVFVNEIEWKWNAQWIFLCITSVFEELPRQFGAVLVALYTGKKIGFVIMCARVRDVMRMRARELVRSH